MRTQIFKFTCALLVALVTASCGLSTADIEKTVKESMWSKFYMEQDSLPFSKEIKLEVTNVRVVKQEGNRYQGVATIGLKTRSSGEFLESRDIPVDIEVNGSEISWKADLLAALDNPKEVSKKQTETSEKKGENSKALLEAVQKGNKAKVAALLSKGADVNVKDSNGVGFEDEYTPLHYAAVSGKKEIAELLIAKGADLNAITKGTRILEGGKITSYIGKQTPLHLALGEGKGAIAKLLIEKGADINAVDYSGQTALHVAAQKGNKSMVALLVAKGANISGKDKNSKTPLDYALTAKNKEVIALLKEKSQ